MSIRPFFQLLPPYLNAVATYGRRSAGPIVYAMQILLRWLAEANTLYHPMFVPLSGVYDDETIAAVKELQSTLNSMGEQLEVDGNFGPQTREAIVRNWGEPDKDDHTLVSWWADVDGSFRRWPPG